MSDEHTLQIKYMFEKFNNQENSGCLKGRGRECHFKKIFALYLFREAMTKTY